MYLLPKNGDFPASHVRFRGVGSWNPSQHESTCPVGWWMILLEHDFLPKKMLHNWSHTTPLDILDHLRACYQRWYCMIVWSFCQLPLYDDPQIFCWVNLHASQGRVLPKTMVTHNWTNTFDSWTHDAWESWICRGGPLNVRWNCETTHSGQIIATSYDLGPPQTMV